MTLKYSLQKKKGYYHAVISYKDASGKFRQKSITTKIPAQKGNKRKAEKIAADLVSAWISTKSQQENEHRELSLQDAFELYNEARRKYLQPSTFAGYVRIGTSAAKYFGDIRLSDLSREKIEDFFNSLREKGTKDNTIRHYCVYINSMLNYTETLGFTLSEPALQIKPPLQQKYKGASYYNVEETKTLLAVASESKIRIPVYIAIYLGLRRSEICGLQWDMIDMKNKTVRICRKVVQYCDSEGKEQLDQSNRMKTQYSDRTLPIPDALYDILSEVVDKTGPVCKHEDGKAMTPQYLTLTFASFLKKNGLRKIRFHDLRHSAASLLLASGASMKEVQVILGHGSYSTTADIYSHIDITGKSRAMAGLNQVLDSST